MNPIRHIEFWVPDFKKSLEFYKELFCVLEWDQVDENGFSKDGTKIYFMEMKNLAAHDGVAGPRHICFQAQDKSVVDAVAKLPKVKSRILHGPEVIHTGGSYMLVFKDPDEYILEVAYKEI